YENANERTSLRYRTLEANKTFNFSFGESAPFEDTEFSRIVSVSALADVSSVEKSGNKAILSGNISVSAILSNDDGAYIGKNYTLPFKSETDMGKYSELFTYVSHASAGQVQSRISDGKIYIDTEITVSLVIFGDKEIDALKACTVYADRPISCETRANVVLYYPSRGDDLWSVAKKYNTTVEKLASANGISKDSLDCGVLIIPTEKPKAKYIKSK
ncbi:MAG: LysM peptidoglycan-binding domain-containing protein, partial [Eubacteriales bacterium]